MLEPPSRARRQGLRTNAGYPSEPFAKATTLTRCLRVLEKWRSSARKRARRKVPASLAGPGRRALRVRLIEAGRGAKNTEKRARRPPGRPNTGREKGGTAKN